MAKRAEDKPTEARVRRAEEQHFKREDVHIQHKLHAYDGAVKVMEVRYDAPRFDGSRMENISRDVVLRHDSAAALVHDTERDVIILCEQMRISVYQAGESGWLG